MTEYRPGTVAVATVRGVEGVRVMTRDDGSDAYTDVYPWTSATPIQGRLVHRGEEVTDIRPLVVLDLADPEALAAELRGVTAPSKARGPLGHLADQIEDQTKPARIPEPGWGAIVEAHTLGAKGDRLRWVRADKGWTNLDAEGEYLNWHEWSTFVDPVLIREGLS